MKLWLKLLKLYYEGSNKALSCAASWNRTNDPLLKRQVLYRLSYSRKHQSSSKMILPQNIQLARGVGLWLLNLHQISIELWIL